MNRFRTASGGRIDRSRTLEFSFDGTRYQGCEGDTLASALLANGVHLVGRSFKYRRPRGILSAGSEEPSALIAIHRDYRRRTPNLRATQVELYEGLAAEGQNRWPSLRFDVGALRGWLSPLIPAGFYYKTFMWPGRAWNSLYEPWIRRAAGLGVAPPSSDPDRYAQRYAHCDVLVVGAGPAGLAAAVRAADSGARVILCDEQAELGGSLLTSPDVTIDGVSGEGWLAEQVRALANNERVTLLPRTTAFGYFPHNLLGLCERLTDHLATPAPLKPRERLWQVRAREVILATGAIERPLVFPGNDRPGVMLAESARTYLNRYGVRVGSRIAVVTACDAAYRAALDLHSHGARIVSIADVCQGAEGPWQQAARRAGIPVRSSSTVVSTAGHLRVRSITLARVTKHGEVAETEPLMCDTVLMSGGVTPSVHLFSQSRGKLKWAEALGCFIPDKPAERVRAVGACRGVFSLAEALADGAGVGAKPFEVNASEADPRGELGRLPRRAGGRGPKSFVDWQNDVSVEDLELAVREGFRSVEHVKRYTTVGMGTDQGKTSNANALGVLSDVLDKPVQDIGVTTFRMPYTPVTFGSLAGYARGELFAPSRKTPIHDWAREQGAVFEDVGLWKRARYFPRPGEDMDAAVARECRAVRTACGLFDASTLGKIEVAGPDAAVFLDRLYINNFQQLAVGRSRYGVLLRDDGFIYDDGVIARIATDRFHVTTTSSGAAGVLSLMEDYLQTEWPDLKVWLTSTTEQWAVIAIQGPGARRVLEGVADHADVAAASLPHMGVRMCRVCGVPARLFRVSFTGELGFEVNVPSDHGRAVWDTIFKAGGAHGITAYGTETMHVLRAEKGYIIVGQDTDGTVTPDDAGLSWAIGKEKPDFLGKRSLQRPAMQVSGRRQLVGLVALDPGRMLEEGAQLIEPSDAPPVRSQGHVTSAYVSAALGQGIALALVAGGRSRMGQVLHVSQADGTWPVKVSSPVFYDPEGVRLRG
jgi:sarcosine oxidase, subunit alpha